MFTFMNSRPSLAAIWVGPIGLRERLPIIPIPLRVPDADARLDLQEALNHVYDASGYEDYIYSGSPDPQLELADRSWAESLLSAAR
jgi:hypothetical protein